MEMLVPDLPPNSPFELFADEAIKILTKRAIRSLQALRETHLQSGDDSVLRDAWDEICVQIQDDQSPLWSASLDTIRAFLTKHCERMPPRDLHSIWRGTDAGFDWLQDVEDGLEDGEIRTYCVEDVVEEVLERVLWKAGDWTNPRIRRYLDRW